jgi:hypothetical protein
MKEREKIGIGCVMLAHTREPDGCSVFDSGENLLKLYLNGRILTKSQYPSLKAPKQVARQSQKPT